MTPPPIKGMTVRPDDCHGIEPALGWPGFLGCVHWALGEEEMRAQFQKDTGIDLLSFVRARGIDRAIDEATGAQGAAFAKFADWVAVNLWGTQP